MALINPLLSAFCYGRLKAIDNFRLHPEQVQHEQFKLLMSYGTGTDYFARYGVEPYTTVEQFTGRIPIVSYDDIQQDIAQVRRGTDGVLWPGVPEWFARSSGTTANVSKYIPITTESLDQCHFQGGRDVMAIFADNYPRSKAFTGKTLTLGGSHQIDPLAADHSSDPSPHKTTARSGDLSAILIHNAPRWVSLLREPSSEVALLADFETKVESICRQCTDKNITAFAGVPSWNLVLMNRVLQYTGKSSLLDVWPDMSLFIHGGVSFLPYREQYQRILPSSQMAYMETYNASEGFFGIQDDPNSGDMLLMLDYGVFYEFLPTRHLGDSSRAVTIDQVTTGENYAMIISTNGGLWRYMIGDTVEFTSLVPHKIRITGRTKSFINAFGEEIIVDNADVAIEAASRATSAKVADYTAAPIYMDAGSKGSHQWLVEFETAPDDIMLFAETLDSTLRSVNSDYAAKRFKNSTLTPPQVIVSHRGTFYRWMQSRGKLGGQNKVPRLSNNRDYIEQLLEMNKIG